MCVDCDTVCVAQDGVVHHFDPGVDGRNGTFVSDNVVEVPTNVPDLVHDVRGSIGDFISNGQAVDVARAVLLHGIDERANVTIDLCGIGKALSSPPKFRIPLIELKLTWEAELAIVPSNNVPSIKATPRSSGGKLTNPDTYEDGKSVFLGSSGGGVKSSACVKSVY